MNSQIIVLSSEAECTIIEQINASTVEVKPLPSLLSTQEEADTKVILHAHKILQGTASTVTIRSPSGDTDIVVLAVALLQEFG